MQNTQQPSGMPIHRYLPFPSRSASTCPTAPGPTKRITKAPQWCAVDLRDGNQALIDPMSPERKRRMFELLVGMGYKEIEVGFPAASQTDFDFVRQLIEEDLVPDDVVIQVLTQAREHLIERTFESIQGAKQAVMHLYNSTSVLQRRVVFGTDMDGIVDIALDGARLCKKLGDAAAGRRPVYFEYSPGVLHRHRARVRGEVCNEVLEVFEPGARPQGHHQPAGDGRDGDAERLRRLDRVDAPPPGAPRERHAEPAPAQRPGDGGGRRRARATWPAPTGSRAACSATASAPATSAWSPWA